MNIVLIGMPGCGKTTLGRVVAKTLGRAFYDCDAIIENESGRKIKQIFEQNGEAEFRTLEAEVIKRFANPQNAVFATGGGAVLNPENIENLKRGGRIIFINRPLENIISDIDTDDRPLLKSGKNRLYELYEQRLPLYKAYSDFEVENIRSLEEVAAEIAALRQQRQVFRL